MGKANVTVNQYFENNERFADLFNVAVFEGKKIVVAEELSEMDTKARRVSREKSGEIYGEEYVRENEAFRHLSEDAYNVITCLGNETELSIKKEEYQNEEGYDMCLALQQMRDESFAKGEMKGRSEGTTEGRAIINLLGRRLVRDGRTDDLVRSLSDDEFQLGLLQEYGLV